MQSTKELSAIVLLSGGLDSTTTLGIACNQGFRVYALSIDYGQRNRFELEAARAIAEHYAVAEHRTHCIDLRAFGGSSLTSDEPVERNRSREEIGSGIPSTYVPVRNTLLLSYALAWADILSITNIFIGVNAVDASGYPDCRPEFIAAYERLAQLATRLGTAKKQKIKIQAPLIKLSKSEIIQRGLELNVPYEMTMTCYDPGADGIACGTCDACILRQRGFYELDAVDPLPYFRPLPRTAQNCKR